MLFLQYGRQAAYIQCKIINAIESKHCDCEKILDEKEHAVKEHNSLPASVIKMNMPDEIFLAVHSGNIFRVEILRQKPTAFPALFSLQDFTAEIIEPPGA